MKTTLGLIFLLLAAFLVWPYVTLHTLDNALQSNDEASLDELLDVAKIRNQITERLARDVDTALGEGDDNVVGWLKRQVNDLGNMAIEEVINTAWVRERLLSKGPLREQISYAFFESWDEFLVRLGELGEEPIHIRLTLRAWQWQVTGVYD